MNKIAIITIFDENNYGNRLQNYAVQKVLEKSGCEVQTLKNYQSFNNNFFSIGRLFLKQVHNLLLKFKMDTTTKNRYRNFHEFTQLYIHTGKVITKKNANKFVSKYDYFITGSDQVWNPNYFQGAMMLDFVTSGEIKKIAYAPSIGVNNLSVKIQHKYKKLLKSYCAVSVREEKAAELLKDISPVPVQVVLDPTMLLTYTEWDELSDRAVIQNEWNTKEDYILCYFVGDRCDYGNYVKQIINETNMQCLVIPINKNASLDGCKTIEGVGPNEFIWLIKNASIVVTDSFHASVFSILYHREFYVLKRFLENSSTSQNSRLHQILGMYLLSERWIEDESRFVRQQNIDYEKSETILREKRLISEEFLRKFI